MLTAFGETKTSYLPFSPSCFSIDLTHRRVIISPDSLTLDIFRSVKSEPYYPYAALLEHFHQLRAKLGFFIERDGGIYPTLI